MHEVCLPVYLYFIECVYNQAYILGDKQLVSFHDRIGYDNQQTTISHLSLDTYVLGKFIKKKKKKEL